MDPLNDELNYVENGELEQTREEALFSSGLSEKTMSIRQPLLRHRSNSSSQITIIGANVCLIESLYRYLKAFLAYAGCNMGLATAVGALCSYIAPDVRYDILEVKASLNGVNAPSILAGSIVSKEGPMVHTSACIANLRGQGGSHKEGLNWAWLRYFKNDQDRRDLVICGVITGAAAAFLTPVGECSSLEDIFHHYPSVHGFKRLYSILLDYKLRVGLIIYYVNAAKITYNSYDLQAIIFLGVAGGVLGSLYNYFVDKIAHIYGFVTTKSFNVKPAATLILLSFSSMTMMMPFRISLVLTQLEFLRFLHSSFSSRQSMVLGSSCMGWLLLMGCSFL
ncbi:hypothetical protein Cgig2_030785 [Carnegiea gigantea]|uniref:Uncharacterized protein n=1 Tax=Carnegiea gigantea TaxID=171969 RepID=A0A9Q1KU23_9CARY|nr:hypothetical protein Cgig2_030785 [Carnegiea gigantea]